MTTSKKQIGFFEKYLTLWVALCIGAGIAIGSFSGESVQFLSELEISRVNLPVAVLIWMMI
ncbi:MAG: arsenical-resistance protein, partial [Prolixibacteraceae bacterium]